MKLLGVDLSTSEPRQKEIHFREESDINKIGHCHIRH